MTALSFGTYGLLDGQVWAGWRDPINGMHHQQQGFCGYADKDNFVRKKLI